MQRIFALAVAAAIALLTCSPAIAADRTWRLGLSPVWIDPDGEFETVRGNGKTVRADIDAELGFDLSAEVRFGRRLGLRFGFLGGSDHRFEIRQDFPDGTDFVAGDSFRFNALTAGVVIHLTPERPIDLYLEPFLIYATYDDVFLPSAGPPFDREEPLDVDVDDQVGGGMALGLDLPLGSDRWLLGIRLSVLGLAFEGDFRNDPEDPEPGSDISLDFNPLILGIGIGYRF